MNRSHRPVKIGWLILIVALIAGGIYWWQHRNPEGGRRPAMPALSPVQAATAVKQSVPYYLTGLGTITAANTATVRSRVDGNLIALHFHEGEEVKAGQLLAEIDPRPYQVALMQAQGQLARDQATLVNARRDLARYEKLAATHLVSAQELDTQRSRVNETLGSIKADEGSVASARLNLTYSKVTAPISGRVGLKQVDIGNYVTSGDSNGIVIITETHPIDMIFTLPENSIASVIAARKSGQPVAVEAWDRSNQQLLSSGTLLSMDNQIDATTGTIRMKARFSNQDDGLFPNQFVNARLKVNTLQDAVVIPTSALQMGNEGHFVWLVSNENSVSRKQVTIGIQDSKIVVINAGLNAGDRVVTDGIDRLTEGARVEVVSPQDAPVTASKTSQPARGEHP